MQVEADIKGMHGRARGINVAAVVCVYRPKLTRARQTEGDERRRRQSGGGGGGGNATERNGGAGTGGLRRWSPSSGGIKTP